MSNMFMTVNQETMDMPLKALFNISMIRTALTLNHKYLDSGELTKLRYGHVDLSSLHLEPNVEAKFKAWCKVNKVKWYDVIAALGGDKAQIQLVSFALGYKFPRFLRVFLNKCDIPVIDLADKDIKVTLDTFMQAKAYEGFCTRMVEEYNYKNVYYLPMYDKATDTYDWYPFTRNKVAA